MTQEVDGYLAPPRNRLTRLGEHVDPHRAQYSASERCAPCVRFLPGARGFLQLREPTKPPGGSPTCGETKGNEWLRAAEQGAWDSTRGPGVGSAPRVLEDLELGTAMDDDRCFD